MGDFIINFYSKHAPNLLPEILVHSPFLRQYSLGQSVCSITGCAYECYKRILAT